MAKLPEYTKLSEKESIFSCKTIDNPKAFDDAIAPLRNTKTTYFFRGVNEAKYKMYTSGQREYIGKEYKKICGCTYWDFVQSLIRPLQQDKDLLQFYKAINKNLSDSFFYTYLQHYGAPTPYIDFSTDIYVALFFCAYKLQQTPSDKEIDNYFSLYYIDNGMSKKDAILRTLYESFKVTEREKKPLQEVFLDPNDQEKRKNKPQFFLTTKELNDISMFYINQEATLGTFAGSRIIYQIPNRNMIAQKGLLIYNNSEKKTLEDMPMFQQKIRCLNIHKSLADYIKTKCVNNGYTHDKIFPDENDIAQSAYQQFKNHPNNNILEVAHDTNQCKEI